MTARSKFVFVFSASVVPEVVLADCRPQVQEASGVLITVLTFWAILMVLGAGVNFATHFLSKAEYKYRTFFTSQNGRDCLRTLVFVSVWFSCFEMLEVAAGPQFWGLYSLSKHLLSSFLVSVLLFLGVRGLARPFSRGRNLVFSALILVLAIGLITPDYQEVGLYCSLRPDQTALHNGCGVQCFSQAKDAGEACTSSEECSGTCLFPKAHGVESCVGTCSEFPVDIRQACAGHEARKLWQEDYNRCEGGKVEEYYPEYRVYC